MGLDMCTTWKIPWKSFSSGYAFAARAHSCRPPLVDRFRLTADRRGRSPRCHCNEHAICSGSITTSIRGS